MAKPNQQKVDQKRLRPSQHRKSAKVKNKHFSTQSLARILESGLETQSNTLQIHRTHVLCLSQVWKTCKGKDVSVKSRARAAVPFSLEPKRSCANCVWLLSRLRTAALLKRIPFYNTAKQWRTLQKLALTSVDPSNTKFSFPSSLASLKQQQKALALTSPRRAKARVGGNSCKAFKACSEQHALLQGCSKV